MVFELLYFTESDDEVFRSIAFRLDDVPTRTNNYNCCYFRNYERIRIFKCLEKKYGNFVIFRYFSLRSGFPL